MATLFFGEADAVLLSVDGLRSCGQLIGLLGASAPRGLMVAGLAERYQEDVAVRGAVRNAATLQLGWFPCFF